MLGVIPGCSMLSGPGGYSARPPVDEGIELDLERLCRIYGGVEEPLQLQADPSGRTHFARLNLELLVVHGQHLAHRTRFL